jgi:hypothetical protein
MNNLPGPRTRTNTRRRCVRGHGLTRTNLDDLSGTYGSGGWRLACDQAALYSFGSASGVADEPGMAEPPDQMPAAAGGGCWRASHVGREQVIGTLKAAFKAAFVTGMLAKEELDLRAAPPAAAATLLLRGPS